MYEKSTEITIRGKTYPMLFNVAALEEIGTRYGGIQELGEKLQEDYGKAINEYTWIIALLVQQGVALANFENNTKEKAITQDEVKLLMKPKEIFDAQEVIMKTINDGMGSNNEEAENQEVDEVLEEVLATKNGDGAEGK